MVRLHLSSTGIDGDELIAGTNRPDDRRIEQPLDIAALSQANCQGRAERRAIADLLGRGKDAARELAGIKLKRRLQRKAFGRGQYLLAVVLVSRDDAASRRLEFAY
jgi:hypothetical protein